MLCLYLNASAKGLEFSLDFEFQKTAIDKAADPNVSNFKMILQHIHLETLEM